MKQIKITIKGREIQAANLANLILIGQDKDNHAVWSGTKEQWRDYKILLGSL